MELIIRKFELLEKTLKQLKETQGDMLGDIVVAIEIGFVHEKSIHSHTFCFHYLIDKYEGDSNVSFMILDTNQQTGQYCFWDYQEYNYKESIRSKGLQIENTKIKIPKTKLSFNYDEQSFFDCVEMVKKDLWETHTKILDTFSKKNIGYDSSMDLFSKELKEYINISYKDIFNLELSSKIKQYNAQLLDTKLNKKEIKTKKIKI